ncbi:MAG: phosphatidate cytidylyltransferase [Muribaculaceae bacterium]|nr:phosphatidate cytidylyltransferase [Muribaculaceae bacterium]
MSLKKVGLRAVSGVVYCGLIVLCIYLGLPGVTALAMLFSALGCVEFNKMTHSVSENTIPAIALDVVGCLCLCFGYLGYPLIVWGVVLLCRFILQLYINSDRPLQGLSRSMLTQIYIGFPMAIMTGIACFFSPMILLAIFILIWLNDTGAFIVGSLMGRHKLFERISPNKTWEGFFGGFLFCVVASWLFGVYCNGFFQTDKYFFTIPAWIILGVIVSTIGTWGDLIESMFKRSLHIKDSGSLIPGHGGILDRIDSLLLVLPALAIYLCTLLMF